MGVYVLCTCCVRAVTLSVSQCVIKKKRNKTPTLLLYNREPYQTCQHAAFQPSCVASRAQRAPQRCIRQCIGACVHSQGSRWRRDGRGRQTCAGPSRARAPRCAPAASPRCAHAPCSVVVVVVVAQGFWWRSVLLPNTYLDILRGRSCELGRTHPRQLPPPELEQAPDQALQVVAAARGGTPQGGRRTVAIGA